MEHEANDRVERYQYLRKLSKDYLSSFVSKEKYADVDLKRIGKLLDVYHDATMVFESENELSVMIDFAIGEKLYNGKSLIDREIESSQVPDPDRKAILEAFRSGYTSLFEVKAANREGHTIQLYDLINDEEREIMDINLSQTILPLKLLFTRIICFNDFSMASGATFVYDARYKDILLRRYRVGLRTRFIIDKSITRFLIFHKLNRAFGDKLRLI